ncbi:hypothetical protein Tco_0150786 [Tanacetum coccineum]
MKIKESLNMTFDETPPPSKSSTKYNRPLKSWFENLETRCIHEGRVVNEDFDNMNNIKTMFGLIKFECLLKINEQIVPRFALEFYSQFKLDYDFEGHVVAHFVIQNKAFSLTLEEFGQILGVPIEGHCSFSNKWSLDYLEFSVPSNGCYQTTPSFPDDIITLIQITQDGPLTRTRHRKTIEDEEEAIKLPNRKT